VSNKYKKFGIWVIMVMQGGVTMIENISIKQIVVITDGCSNYGENPALAAAEARRHGITVNAIGIIDDGMEAGARREVEAIAHAGQGIADFATLDKLSHSIQALTRCSMQMTVEKAIHRQLEAIVGPGGMRDIPPKKRGEVVALWENLCEDTCLQCAILLDTSGSMQNRLVEAERSIGELLQSLQARRGESAVAVATFPGTGMEPYYLITDFTADVTKVKQKISGIRAGGNTPTGPAIRQAINLFEENTKPIFGECVV
jgi:Ca-activated chloride channel family protein